MDADLVFLTGRSNCIREETMSWIKHNMFVYDPIILVMRKTGDFRKGSIVKEELFLNTIDILYPENTNYMFFDDDIEVLPLYSKYGIAFRAPYCWKYISV